MQQSRNRLGVSARHARLWAGALLGLAVIASMGCQRAPADAAGAAPTAAPVSYTHLDVYKRQALTLAFEANREFVRAALDMETFTCGHAIDTPHRLAKVR